MPEMLTNREAADVIGVIPNTMDVWRSRNVGPPYFKVMGAIRYDKAELIEWLPNALWRWCGEVFGMSLSRCQRDAQPVERATVREPNHG